MATYYDVVLALIPISLLGVAGGLSGVGIDLTIAVPLGAVAAAGLIGHAMFVRAPIEPPNSSSSAESGFAPAAD